MKQRKILSFLLAFVMLFGIVAPSVSFAADVTEPTGTVGADQVYKNADGTVSTTAPTTTTLNVYKLYAKSFNSAEGWKHSGGVIGEQELGGLGDNVIKLPGVTFSYYKVTDEQLATLKATPTSYDTVDEVKAFLSGAEPTGTITTDKDGLGKTANGNLELGTGAYWFVESGYDKAKAAETLGENAPDKITSQIAVPFGITLPLMNQTAITDGATTYEPGTVYLNTVNVYPKNVGTDKVQIDKNFVKENDLSQEEIDQAIVDGRLSPTVGADINNYDKDKARVTAELGKKIPYEVVTVIPQNNTYTTMSWSDIMTKGLTYNKDLKVFIDGTEVTELTATNGVANTPSDFGFDLQFTENGAIMQSIADKVKEGDVTIRLTYSATVNGEGVVDNPEKNNVTFTPGEPNPGQSVKPKTDGDDTVIDVTKSWAGGTAPTGVEVTYYLIADNKVVDSYTTTGPDYSHRFKNLDINTTYTVREVVRGYDPSYTSTADGEVTVTNTANPDTLVPKSPEVVTGGKKFVKADEQSGARLAGAEFVITNQKADGSDLKYLVRKTGDQIAAEQTTVTEAKTALDNAIKAYNDLTAEQQVGQDGTNAKKAINDAQIAYNNAVKAAGSEYTWGTKEDAVVFVSNDKGQFEVTGLAYGTYYIEEIKAPAGYAKLEERQEFKVAQGSYTADAAGVVYEGTDSVTDGATGADAQRVNNRNLTIPQTGGIGTVIFTVAGIALMGGAAVAMKKRGEEDEE